MILDRLRCFAGLAVDAVEAVLWLWPSDKAADVLWGETQADRLVEKEAEEEVAEPSKQVCVECGQECNYGCYISPPKRAEILAQMTTDAAEDDMYSKVNGFVDTRPDSPAGGEAPNPPADAPRCTSPDPSAGQPTSGRSGNGPAEPSDFDRFVEKFNRETAKAPTMTSIDFYDASYAAMEYADRCGSAPTAEKFYALAKKFDAAAKAITARAMRSETSP